MVNQKHTQQNSNDLFHDKVFSSLHVVAFHLAVLLPDVDVDARFFLLFFFFLWSNQTSACNQYTPDCFYTVSDFKLILTGASKLALVDVSMLTFSATSYVFHHLMVSPHISLSQKLHATSGKRCGTSARLSPDGWPGTFPGGLEFTSQGCSHADLTQTGKEDGRSGATIASLTHKRRPAKTKQPKP